LDGRIWFTHPGTCAEQGGSDIDSYKNGFDSLNSVFPGLI
jgi:hypothetical protein